MDAQVDGPAPPRPRAGGSTRTGPAAGRPLPRGGPPAGSGPPRGGRGCRSCGSACPRARRHPAGADSIPAVVHLGQCRRSEEVAMAVAWAWGTAGMNRRSDRSGARWRAARDARTAQAYRPPPRPAPPPRPPGRRARWSGSSQGARARPDPASRREAPTTPTACSAGSPPAPPGAARRRRTACPSPPPSRPRTQGPRASGGVRMAGGARTAASPPPRDRAPCTSLRGTACPPPAAAWRRAHPPSPRASTRSAHDAHVAAGVGRHGEQDEPQRRGVRPLADPHHRRAGDRQRNGHRAQRSPARPCTALAASASVAIFTDGGGAPSTPPPAGAPRTTPPGRRRSARRRTQARPRRGERAGASHVTISTTDARIPSGTCASPAARTRSRAAGTASRAVVNSREAK